jgi:DNA repair protein RecO (recombination protein O)
MRVDLHPCFILHQRRYRETSLLLEVFSELHGRVGLVVKGASRKKGGVRHQCQPFLALQIGWSGRGELGNLTSIEQYGPLIHLAGDKLFSGFYLNELLIRLLHRDDPHPELFNIYEHTLKNLAECSSIESVLRIFEKRLLEQLGYGLNFDHEFTTGATIEADQEYEYLLDHGPRLLDSAEINVSGVRVSGRSLLALLQETELNDESLKEAKKLMRYALSPHLGDKPLQSRRILESMKK